VAPYSTNSGSLKSSDRHDERKLLATSCPAWWAPGAPGCWGGWRARRGRRAARPWAAARRPSPSTAAWGSAATAPGRSPGRTSSPQTARPPATPKLLLAKHVSTRTLSSLRMLSTLLPTSSLKTWPAKASAITSMFRDRPFTRLADPLLQHQAFWEMTRWRPGSSKRKPAGFVSSVTWGRG